MVLYYLAHASRAFTLSSAQVLLMTLRNTLKSEFLYSNLVMCCATRKVRTAYENFTHELLNQQHEVHWIRTIHISASMAFLSMVVQAMKFQPQGFYKNRLFMRVATVLSYVALILNHRHVK